MKLPQAHSSLRYCAVDEAFALATCGLAPAADATPSATLLRSPSLEPATNALTAASIESAAMILYLCEALRAGSKREANTGLVSYGWCGSCPTVLRKTVSYAWCVPKFLAITVTWESVFRMVWPSEWHQWVRRGHTCNRNWQKGSSLTTSSQGPRHVEVPLANIQQDLGLLH